MARFVKVMLVNSAIGATAVIEIVEHGRGVYLVDKDVEALRGSENWRASSLTRTVTT